jgi:hypothetical protein
MSRGPVVLTLPRLGLGQLREFSPRIFVRAHPYEESPWLQAVSEVSSCQKTYSEVFALAMIVIGMVLLSAALMVRLDLRPSRLEVDPDSDRWA